MDFTKKEIQSAFWQLLEERPFGKITVKAVVARCGVNRNTFYYHFQDLRDLLRTSVLGWLDELFADGAGAAAVVAADNPCALEAMLPRSAPVSTGTISRAVRAALSAVRAQISAAPLRIFDSTAVIRRISALAPLNPSALRISVPDARASD